MTPNHAIERTADPLHASCLRTCRAAEADPLSPDNGRSYVVPDYCRAQDGCLAFVNNG